MESVVVMNTLREIGFIDSVDTTALEKDALIYDFGLFKLRAFPSGDLFGNSAVLFLGQYITPRTAAFIDFHLPGQLASVEQLKAILAFNLRSHFRSGNVPALISEGLELSDHLPGRENWAEERRLSKVIESVFVEHAWFKVFSKNLIMHAEQADSREQTRIVFKDNIVNFFCGKKHFGVMGVGKNWDKAIIIETMSLKRIPKRISMKGVEISYSLKGLQIGYDIFPVVEVKEVTAYPHYP